MSKKQPPTLRQKLAKRTEKPADKYVLWIVLVLAAAGIVAVYSAISFLAETKADGESGVESGNGGALAQFTSSVAPLVSSHRSCHAVYFVSRFARVETRPVRRAESGERFSDLAPRPSPSALRYDNAS